MQRILEKRVVPVAVVENAADAVPLAQALLRGGLDIIEITFRTAAAEQCIRLITQAFPEMLVGAGTILTPDQVDLAVAAGAGFGVSPGLNEKVVFRASECGLPFVPGVMTPTEIEKGMELGCKLLKFFPAESAGGVKALQAYASPYAHTGVKFIPLGGINVTNAPAYLALPLVAAIGGSWITEKKLIKEQRWDEITRLAAEAVKLAQGK